MDYDKEFELLYNMQQAYSSLFLVSNKIQIAGDKYCEPLTSRQYMTMLAILHIEEDKRTFINIAQKLGTTKQNATQLIKVLEKKGYVNIEPSKLDKRSVNVNVTESGYKILSVCGENGGVYLMADLFRDFSEDEIKILWNLLKKLYRFDGESMNGFEENVNTPQITDERTKEALERFNKRRNKDSV